ncbi:GNAT family N-acetyltransferase [Bacillus shivajii]|uniref:GNAT family N-acetyltransferase n=1 Tax=Bacillus shivajii TaxID=1983719 RepID=UPI001CFBDE5B|nr:GNAT family N-acetyltransferase [Bacillus shivajii]UCZ54029.1 GNAT family N-acetyltransferase [Bacillus shivajii]
MNIRQARTGDEACITDVHIQSWQKAYQGTLPDDLLNNLSYEKRFEQWKQAIANSSDGYGLFVAENDNGDIVGFASCGKSRSLEKFPEYAGELYAIYLLPTEVRKGIGRQLSDRVVTHLKRHSMNSMIIWVLQDNDACLFYKDLGGRFIGSDRLRIGDEYYTEIAYGWKEI